MSAPLRVGVVGVGVMGADHARRLARGVAGATLVAVSDPDVARAQELAGRLGADDLGSGSVAVVPDPLELIRTDAVDAVVLASPGHAHEEQVRECIETGTPVLCEKPLTTDGASSARLVRAERDGGRPLVQVGFMRRFDPEYVQLRDLLTSGRVGRPLLAHQVHRNLAAPRADFRSEMIVRDSLVHEIDTARYLFGEEVVEIQVITPSPSSLVPDGVADPQVVVLRMAGGAVVTNEVFVGSSTGYEVRCEVVAERGSAAVGRPSGGICSTAAGPHGGAGSWGGALPVDYRERFARAYDLELQAWVDASRRGEVVGARSRDGYAATVVATAGVASLASGRPVVVELDPEL